MSTASTASANSASNTASNKAAKVTTKLPKLMIKPFSVNAYNRQVFRNSFRTSIHENKTLNKADRFNYLCSYLEGPVLAAINGFSLTEANYHNAIELLAALFGNKQCTIYRHTLSSCLSYQMLCPQEIHERLRKFHDTIETHTCG